MKAIRLQLMEIARLLDRGLTSPVVGAVIPLADARKAFEKMYQPGKKKEKSCCRSANE